MLVLDKVCFAYGKTQILKDVSLKIDRGVALIVGANGEGKSTVLKLISGLLKVDSGDIQYQGVSLLSMKPHEIVDKGIVHVPERSRVFPKLSVKQNLEIGAYRRKDKDEVQKDYNYVCDLMPLLRIRESQHGGTLSGGEQQMLAIARGYMSRPRIFIVDEPTLGLAPLMAETIKEILLKIKTEKGVPILIMEENLDALADIADRMLLLRYGELKLMGSYEETLENIRLHLAR